VWEDWIYRGRSDKPFYCAPRNSSFVDALSHALIAVILFSGPGLLPLIPFAVLGAVIPDIDILFVRISDRNPSLYLFTHGGIAHSIAGVFVLSLIAYSTVILLAAAGIIPAGAPAAAGMYGFAAILAGALLHLLIDVSAIPGIPVLAPFSDRKYTLGILPGPSLLLAVAAFGLVVVTVLSILSFSSALVLYGMIVIFSLAVRVGIFLIATGTLPGRKIPTINPLRWLVIEEDESSYMTRYYTLFRGCSDDAVFEKFRNTDSHEIAVASYLPEVRRLRFFSYIVTAERTGSVLVLSDPLRERGLLYYPTNYKRVEVKLDT
jgi:inner membrane protein